MNNKAKVSGEFRSNKLESNKYMSTNPRSRKSTKSGATLGFTLIELLFVVAIISVLASLGLSMMQKRSQEAKIEKTALQMQQLMQAGMAYYVDNGCWPTSKGVTPPEPAAACSVSPAPPFEGYIPVSGDINAWGSAYRYGPAKTGAGLGSKSYMFEISVATPDPDSSSNNPIATRIAGMLPNAAAGADKICMAGAACCTTSNCVYAQVSMPAQATTGSGDVVVAGAGTMQYVASDFDSYPTNPNYYKVKDGSLKSTNSFKCSSEYPYSGVQIVPQETTFVETASADSKNTNLPAIPIGVTYTYTENSASSPAKSYIINAYVYGRTCYSEVRVSHAVYQHCFDGVTKLFKQITLGYTIYCCKNEQYCPKSVSPPSAPT